MSLGPLDAQNRVEQQNPLVAPAVQVPGLGGRDAAATLSGQHKHDGVEGHMCFFH